MTARYLIRFDDVCPSMDWEIWDQVEAMLIEKDISPLLAVVPDNRDPYLEIDSPRPDFWDRVREWQARGWTIALHGFQHVYESEDTGVIGINPFSEFAGLSEQAQQAKIDRALEIFRRENVRVDGWVAPGHSFDQVTVKVLSEQGVGLVSDGFFLGPRRRWSMAWLPQQIWRFRSFPFGVWTVCYHHNLFDEQGVADFARDLSAYRDRIIAIKDLPPFESWGRYGLFDSLFSLMWKSLVLGKRQAS